MLFLRIESVKQLSGLDHLARSNNKKSFEGNYSNTTSKESDIVSQFHSVSYVFLKISFNIQILNILRIY